ncbi:DNA-binding transcriptional LysR family regulator [Stackebrandtia albiflava]|uniref:DNA-binding transcriptional LysR family regulator n=1 Tax=Stackebrandtia albiflava TaxID=406432 RepID=A0A562VE84_9ACTN|nr:LysR family transcriptional regulator [Stackebrandtia albiflava]TWJ16193.1 DNA-binding transcriptional LysR family regulator [Stackebrandtia albiflava]
MDRLDLSLTQLHAFTVLAEELHFGRAAARLGIAQPPLSQQIQRLETKVGHPLFHRTAAGVTLTAAGSTLLPAARESLGALASGLADARTAAAGRSGRLRIGFAASLALTVLPRVLRDHRTAYPGVTLDIREMTTADQLTALTEHRIDVGVMREPPDVMTGLRFTTLWDEPLVAILPKGHPLAERRTVRTADLAGSPFVLLPRTAGPGLYDRIAGLCTDAGFQPRIAQSAVEWLTVCGLVEIGVGVSIGPACIRRIAMKGIALRRIDPAARTRVALGWRAGDPNPLVGNLRGTFGEMS